jgi:hypothetical protein
MYVDIQLQAIATEARMYQRKPGSPGSPPDRRRSPDRTRRASWLWTHLSRPAPLVRPSTPYADPAQSDC